MCSFIFSVVILDHTVFSSLSVSRCAYTLNYTRSKACHSILHCGEAGPSERMGGAPCLAGGGEHILYDPLQMLLVRIWQKKKKKYSMHLRCVFENDQSVLFFFFFYFDRSYNSHTAGLMLMKELCMLLLIGLRGSCIAHRGRHVHRRRRAVQLTNKSLSLSLSGLKIPNFTHFLNTHDLFKYSCTQL